MIEAFSRINERHLSPHSGIPTNPKAGRRKRKLPTSTHRGHTAKQQTQNDDHESSQKGRTDRPKGMTVTLTAAFSTATMEARRQWKNLFQARKENRFYPPSSKSE